MQKVRFQGSRFSRISRYLNGDTIIAMVVLLAGVAICLAIFHNALSRDESQARLNFRLQAEETISSIENKITENSTTIRAVASYFNVSQHVSRHLFSEFVGPFLKNNASIRGLQWVPLVRNSERSRYEWVARSEGLHDFHFKEWASRNVLRIAGTRPDYFIVYYSEPLSTNRTVIGLDTGSEAVRRRFLMDSGRRGSETFSPPISLIQGNLRQRGYLVYQPVYDSYSPGDSPEARLNHLRGFAAGAFQMDDVLRSVLDPREMKGFRMEITDVTDCEHPKTLGGVGEQGTVRGLSYDQIHSFGDRKWRFHIVPCKSFISPSHLLAWIRLIFSLSLTFLVFFFLIYRSGATRMLRLHSAALNAADDLIAILHLDGRIEFANDSLLRHSGYERDQIVGQCLSMLWSGMEEGGPQRSILEAVRAGSAWSGEVPCRAKDGYECTADVTVTPLYDDSGRCERMIMIARNITERKEYEGLLSYQAHHDALTNLPNRVLFAQEVGVTVNDCARDSRKCAVLFIDLDNFKMVNDTMGHQAGDELLKQTASRLNSCLRDGDLLSRMGGDEFTVLLRDLKSKSDAALIAQRMLDQIAIPYEVEGSRLVVGASIGISTYPQDAVDVDGLLKDADAAMYKAKEQGRNNCQFFTDELSRANQARVDMERDLRLAVERNELLVYYQPIVDVETMEILGAEALLRWDHPTKGMISPSLFIPIAEETGLILEMSRMVLRSACRQCTMWRTSGYSDFQISVNISPVHLGKAEFGKDVQDILAQTGLSPRRLNLEITEGNLTRTDGQGIEALSRLNDMEIKICLDDFGIAYSSLSRLKDLPILRMKIDGSFIRDISHNPHDRAMTQSIVSMAHNLGIKVTAEWIEHEEQMSIIRELGCDYAQGFLISPALSVEAFGEFMTEWMSGRMAIKAA